MVQTLPTEEITVCDNNNYITSSSNVGYIYTLDIKTNEELKQKTKKYAFFPETQKLTLNSLQIIKMSRKNSKPNEK